MIIRKMIEAGKKLPLVGSFIKTPAWQSVRHRIALLTSDRTVATFTGFFRLPTQFEALSGPVLSALFPDGANRPVKITVIGCSKGAEAYSIASILKSQHPELNFSICAYDLNENVIKKAKRARYAPEEVYIKRIPAVLMNATFDREEDFYVVKPEIAQKVIFDLCDALDPHLKKNIGTADIVFAQNFLFHMKPWIATKAFSNICNLMNDKAALFIDGMDVGLRYRLTKRNDLVPLPYKIEDIHNEARVARSPGWPYCYWGLEPFSTSKREWQRRYSTIFLRKDSFRTL